MSAGAGVGGAGVSETSSRGPSRVTIGPDRRLDVGGRPFFPLGARYAPDGAAPEVLVDDVINTLRTLGEVEVSTLPGRQENIEFRLPRELATS